MEIVNIYAEKCGYFTVYIQGTKPKDAPVLVTVPDLGCNHEYFSSFTDRFMVGRFCWCHVELPGQSYGAEDWRPDAELVSGQKDSGAHSPSSAVVVKPSRRFSISASGPSFPNMQELAAGILTVLEKLELSQVVLIGEGSGANLLSRVVILNDSRVLGLVLIHGRCTPSGPLQRLREKMKSSNEIKLDNNTEKYLLEHRFSATTNNGMPPEMKKEFASYRSALMEKVNPRNLNQLIYCYAHRKTLADTVNRIACPLLLVSGSRSEHRANVRHMYELINKARKNEGQSLRLMELIEVLDCVSPLIETPEKVAESITYFLQGLGLVMGVNIRTPSIAVPYVQMSGDQALEVGGDVSEESPGEADARMAALARSCQRQMSMADLDMPRGPGAFSSANWSEALQHTASSGREHGY